MKIHLAVKMVIYNAEQVDICVCAVKTVNYNEFKLLIAFYY